jgi:hypothetical protein
MDITKLEIKESSRDDTGQYTVIIRNPLGQVRSSVQLIVEEYKYFIELSLENYKLNL